MPINRYTPSPVKVSFTVRHKCIAGGAFLFIRENVYYFYYYCPRKAPFIPMRAIHFASLKLASLIGKSALVGGVSFREQGRVKRWGLYENTFTH